MYEREMNELRTSKQVEISKIYGRLQEQYQERLQSALQERESDNLTIWVDDGLICCKHHSKLNEILSRSHGDINICSN